jgi:hypothetical protein
MGTSRIQLLNGPALASERQLPGTSTSHARYTEVRMAIDDLSSERALQRLRMEDLSKAPPAVLRVPGNILKVLTALLSGDTSQAADLFSSYQDAFESERSAYLFECVIEDLRWLRDRLNQLSSEQHEYLSTDWPRLLLDADRKARATRAKARIKRIAEIVCSSIRAKPLPPPDLTEEMMRIATELSDDDVLVLRAVAEAWDRYEHLPAGAIHKIEMPEVAGIPGESVLGTCGKLQSLGLIANPEQRARALSQFTYPTGGGFVPLQRAQAFLRAIATFGDQP